MLALIGNLSLLELVVIAVVAVLIFGRRLPEVAGQAAAQVMKAKRALTDLRRETGIDEELRRARQVVYEAAREASSPTPKQRREGAPGTAARDEDPPRLVPPPLEADAPEEAVSEAAEEPSGAPRLAAWDEPSGEPGAPGRVEPGRVEPDRDEPGRVERGSDER